MKKHFLNLLFIILVACVNFNFSLTGQPVITLEKIFKERYFFPRYIGNIRSLADGEHYTILENNQQIVKYDYKTGKIREVVFSVSSPETSEINNISNYVFSNDETRILISSDETPIYRYSSEARYYVYDRKIKKAVPLLNEGKQQLATFSPDGNSVAFVLKNNLYVKDLISGEVRAVTTDGSVNHIINGAPDWVYEEEFGFSKAFCWSPDSRRIAFYRFDESDVKQFEITTYESLYPQTYRYKYPKAGENNSIVSIHITDLLTNKTITASAGNETDQYIPRIKWTMNPEKLCIIRLNRRQDKVDVLLTDAVTGKTDVIYTESNSRYISEIDDNFIEFLEGGQFFIIKSERDKYFHYYRYSIDGQLINQITRGEWDVDKLLGINQKDGIIYYTSTEASALQRDVYAIKTDGTGKRKLSLHSGTNNAEFSSTFRYFVNYFASANQPPYITINDISGREIRVLEDNKRLIERMKEYNYTKKSFIRISVSGNIELNAYIIKPADFDSAKKYPVFMHVYGGPESQSVTDDWDNSLAWEQMMVQHGYIVVCVDNRGTDGRGEDFRKVTYLQLGRYETEDQIAAASYLATLPYVDAKRIGIWGWSYGGYMSLLCIMKGADIFRMAIAVAPVTNWRYYDSIYTERFMRKPDENASGYDENSPINHVNKLRGSLLIIHGTADDNVHLQNTMELAERLIQADKKFDMFLYPDKNHGIYGGNTRLHLYRKMTDFVLNNL
jgi:dipeptidyl-peptidase-4